jgi:apolipoprotein D and lipocalin family protein
MKNMTVVLVLLLTGCIGIPDNVRPVDHFKLERYLGHSFERGLSRVTANYSVRDDGGVRVVNRGFSAKDNKWKEAEGRAHFVETPDRGYLKVSFFGPFYGAYIVFELDHDNYQYSLVSGPDKSYLWILARSPQIGKDVKDRLVAKAAAAGFDTTKLIFVGHD